MRSSLPDLCSVGVMLAKTSLPSSPLFERAASCHLAADCSEDSLPSTGRLLLVLQPKCNIPKSALGLILASQVSYFQPCESPPGLGCSLRQHQEERHQRTTRMKRFRSKREVEKFNSNKVCQFGSENGTKSRGFTRLLIQ